MNNTAIIVVALAVLACAVLLIVREFARARRPQTGPVTIAESRKAHSVPPPRAAGDDDPDADDVTKVGNMKRRPASALPQLDRDLDVDIDDAVSESTALTIYEEGAELDEPTGPSDLILLSAAAQSDIGKKRRRNEDSFLLDDDRSLFVVADGMGGYAGGDVASQLATTTIADFLRGRSEPGHLPVRPKMPKMGNELVAAIEAANTAIHTESERNPDYHGMGTTIVAASFTKRKRRAYIAYAGDSRCYRYRDGRLKLLTVDHTYAAKGVTGPVGNQIRRAVGVKSTVKVDLIVDSPMSGDAYLLCSDGLNKMLTDDVLQKIVTTNKDDIVGCARCLVREANEAGGKDNVTVVVVKVEQPQSRTSSADGPVAAMNA